MAVKILTVDDSKTIRLIVARAFKSFDCEIFEASNGVEGIAVAAREKPDLIILDITMPIMDGTETLRKLKSDAALKPIPVIMLTAESGRENVLKIAKMGIRDYIVKPFKEDQLIDKAGRVVNLQSKSQGKAAVKTLADAVSILVVDDKPAISQQIAEGLSNTPWKINGKTSAAEGMHEASSSVPDAILISLSLDGGAGFNLFQQLRGFAKTRAVPIFGMCIKTDTETQSRAEQTGFSGVITKPIDIEALKMKLIRAMSIDTSLLYFSMDENIQYLTLTGKVTSQVTGEVERYLAAKINDMANAGMNKFIVDLSKVTDFDVPLIRTIITLVQSCQELSIRVRMVGNQTVNVKLKAFQEISDMTLDASLEEAQAVLLGQPKPASNQASEVTASESMEGKAPANASAT
ncbi:MAG: response regulator [Verrucomicrobia bacterium]|nr:response regulator [Verrucomicrobiota bacterium]